VRRQVAAVSRALARRPQGASGTRGNGLLGRNRQGACGAEEWCIAALNNRWIACYAGGERHLRFL